MLVQTFACLIFVILGGDVDAYKPPGNSQNQESSKNAAISHSESSSASHSSSSSSSSSSEASTYDNKIQCGKNSAYTRCPNPCPRTCGNPNGVRNCHKKCQAYGCECNPGYVVSENGKCEELENCPDYLRCNDRNATFKECPNPCPGTCSFPGRVPCDQTCVENGCECNEGFYLNDKRKCVQLQDCPEAKTCSVNETFVFCKVGCPTNDCPVDDNRGIIACSPPFPCGSGCSCRNDYLRNTEGMCILYSDCPPINCTRPNEVYNARPPPCIFESCTDIGKVNQCDRTYPSRPQCLCMAGFYRNKDDICVPQEECPKPPPNCGKNEVPSDCKIQCPPQTCEAEYTDYYCTDVPCKPGCNCLPDFLRNATGDCIPNKACPSPPTTLNCKENEVASPCKIVCPPQTCASLYTLYSCLAYIDCEWGCDCKKGYLRDGSGETGKCIPSEECPAKPCGYNEVFSKCMITCPPQTCNSTFTSYLCSNETVCEAGCDCRNGYLRNDSNICVPSEECFSGQPACDVAPECRPTCANPRPNCQPDLPRNQKNQDGCKCEPGSILSDTNGVCIKFEECPEIGCNGDPNAVLMAYPWSSPSTCNSPNAESYGKTCNKIGCQCKPGYILSESCQKCIVPDNCEYGDPCGANGTFSECAFRCPDQYCPENDSQGKVACRPGRPCPSGCTCKQYHLKRSYTDETCVLASDCPPVTCTRPNEVWQPCASECLAESCNDLITKSECYPNPENCQPQCVCYEGYYRNASGLCVPKADCQINCEIQQECRPTCAVPNPPNCPFIPPSNVNVDSCNCQSGYVLSVAGGECIKVEECPVDRTCNGDPNATIKECPLPCPSTCASPNAESCDKVCDPIGCECKPGYLRSRTGKCILPDDCKGGNPCGPNATFVACRFDCPTNYCPTDDSRGVIVCESYPFSPCFSGCSCRLNHKRLSREDPRCIVSSECPPVECTRPHEKWNSCPSPCNSEYCDAVDSPPAPCNSLVLNCDPKCQCRKSYFRNDSDICVSSRQCRRLNKQKQCS